MYVYLKIYFLIYFYLKESIIFLLEDILEGIKPPIKVITKLIIIKIIICLKLKIATLESEVTFFIIILTGIINTFVTIIPNIPEDIPIIKFSALNTLDISFFLAPKLLKIPISLVL